MQANATMIVGILFVVTIFQIKAKQRIGTGLYLACIAGIIPFSVSSLEILTDSYDNARFFSGAGFILFAVMLFFYTSFWFREEHETKEKVSQSKPKEKLLKTDER